MILNFSCVGAPSCIPEKFKRFLRGISSGFLTLTYLISYYSSYISTENLLLEKSCRINANLSGKTCDAMVLRNRSAYGENQELKVQKIVSEVQIYISFIQGFFPVLCMALLGSWSDKTNRRKPLIIVPILGHVLTQIGLMICHVFHNIPITYVALAQSVPYSVFGGKYCYYTGLYSYMAAHTEVESRTQGVGSLIAFDCLALIIGKALGGVLFKTVGYLGVYSFSIGSFLLCVLYTSCILPPEVPKEITKGKDTRLECIDFSKVCTMIFDLDPRKKPKICLVILCGFLSNASFDGESSIVYIYTRKKYNWDEIDYSIYNSTMFTLELVGTYISIYVFMKFFRLRDLTVGIIGILSGLLYSLVSTFSQNTFIFYSGTFVGMFAGNLIISVRALILKISDMEEIGRVNSFFGICNAMTPLVGGTIYNGIYRNTLEYFPGSFYLISTTVCLIIFVIFLYLLRLDADRMEEKRKDSRTCCQL